MDNNNTSAIVLTAVISAVTAAALTAAIIFAVQNRQQIKAAAIRVKDKSVDVANNLKGKTVYVATNIKDKTVNAANTIKAKLIKKKNVEVCMDENCDIPEELTFEEADADLQILTVED